MGAVNIVGGVVMDKEAMDDTNSGILDLAVSVSVKISQSTYFLVRTLVFESIRHIAPYGI